MTSDEFRTLFNRNRMMTVTLLDGQHTLAIGLNGEGLILFGGDEMPLTWFKPNPLNGGIFQYATVHGPFDLVEAGQARLHLPGHHARAAAIDEAARRLGATNSDIPGLWTVPGHPELTTNQLLDLATRDDGR